MQIIAFRLKKFLASETWNGSSYIDSLWVLDDEFCLQSVGNNCLLSSVQYSLSKYKYWPNRDSCNIHVKLKNVGCQLCANLKEADDTVRAEGDKDGIPPLLLFCLGFIDMFGQHQSNEKMILLKARLLWHKPMIRCSRAHFINWIK